MGEKRVSWKAEVNAYDESPEESSCGSKVPMQPRRFRTPEFADTVFQVTKRGDSVMDSLRCDVRRPIPMGVKDSSDDVGVVLAVEGARDTEEVEDDEGVELLGIRETAGLRNADVDNKVEDLPDVSISSSSSPSDPSASDSFSSPLGYSAHDNCTWFKVIGVRFSRLAASASKQ